MKTSELIHTLEAGQFIGTVVSGDRASEVAKQAARAASEGGKKS